MDVPTQSPRDDAHLDQLADWLEDAAHNTCCPHDRKPYETCWYCLTGALVAGGVPPVLMLVKAEALREFADTRGVNVGDEDSEWWQGYRQAQRECLHDATARATSIVTEATA